MAYLTPENPPPARLRAWRVFIPDDYTWRARLTGALAELADPDNWQDYGPTDPETTARIFEDALIRYLDDQMIGELVPYVTIHPGPGLLTCDGSVYARADYPHLYAVIDPAYHVPPDHFYVPDLRGRTIIGNGSGPGLSIRYVGEEGGSEDHALTVDEMPAHTHTTQPHTHSEGTAAPAIINGGIEAPASAAVPTIGSTGPATVIVNSAGAGLAHENMPPFHVVRWAIRAF